MFVQVSLGRGVPFPAMDAAVDVHPGGLDGLFLAVVPNLADASSPLLMREYHNFTNQLVSLNVATFSAPNFSSTACLTPG